jgi:hypothetical protein
VLAGGVGFGRRPSKQSAIAANYHRRLQMHRVSRKKMVLDTLVIVALVGAIVLAIRWLEGASLLPPNW